MVSFIPALQLTSVSNVAIIIATGPLVAAGLAWIWLREAPRLTTLIASVVALCGVAIIVGDAGGISDFSGIGLACLMTLAGDDGCGSAA
jgi:drug/metabolite transporter (DMT)-like permease